MPSINVLLTAEIDAESARLITGVSPEIKLTDAWQVFRDEQKGVPGARSKLDALLAQTEIIYGRRLPEHVTTRAPRLKWIQTSLAGVDGCLNDELRRSPVTMTNVSGIHRTAVSEFVFTMMLMLAKHAPAWFQLKQEKRWGNFVFVPSVLRGQTVGIVGLGNIGRGVAHLGKAFGMRVLATRRSGKRVSRARNVDALFPADRLPDLLRESDYVVLTLPLTPETRGLIGEEQLKAMKPTAYLVNVSRGGVVDEDALLRALEEHWIAGAGLDVFTQEPLPRESRFWDLPNVIISPHRAGNTSDYMVRATGVFAENLKHYINGEKLHNVVIKNRGY